MKKYAGITIGPIFDTISDATSPAALWFASTFFSDLTRRICMKIRTKYADDKYKLKIVSPWFDEDDAGGLKEGVGKYHDRIFFSVEDIEETELKSDLDDIIKSVKGEMADNFGEFFFRRTGQQEGTVKAFLSGYLQIHYIILDEEQIGDSNCILMISPYLDTLELMKTFPVSDKDNPFRRLMLGIEEAGNVLIRNSRLYQNVDKEQNPLKNDNDTIWSLQEIARGKRKDNIPDDKYLNYYAVVSADADGMGKFLNSISNLPEKIQMFSERCLSYDKKAAKAINDYGGMAIYAGGDDLLFLAPVMNGKETIFDICEEISQLFKKEIQGEKRDFVDEMIPTVSFGVSVQYYKYPLYEALNRSRECLGTAKKYQNLSDDSLEMKPQKNCIYLYLEKHSGQSADLLIGNEAADVYISLLKEMAEKGIRKNEIDEKMVRSLGAKLYDCRNIIKVMDENYEKRALCEPSWDNLFDNEGQENGKEFREYVEKWYYGHLVDEKRRIVTVSGYTGSNSGNERRFYSLLAALRIGKFFLEKKGGE